MKGWRTKGMNGLIGRLSRVAAIVVSMAPGVVAFAQTGDGSNGETKETRKRIVIRHGDAGEGSDREVRALVHESSAGYYEFSSNNQHVKVELRNGEVSKAEVDGKSVPADRVKLDDGKLTITDEQGGVLFAHEFRADDPGVSSRSGAGIRAGAGRGMWIHRDDEDDDGKMMVWRGRPEVEPKSMLGIQMADVPDALRGHYGLQEDDGVMIAGIHKGLPAEQAGLKPYEIVVAMDGRRPIEDDDIRDKLRTMEPGGSIEFTVLSKGVERTVRLTAEKFDWEKLSKAESSGIARRRHIEMFEDEIEDELFDDDDVRVFIGPGHGPMFVEPFGDPKDPEFAARMEAEMQKLVERLTAEHRGLIREHEGAMRNRDSIEERLQRMEKLMEQMLKDRNPKHEAPGKDEDEKSRT